MSKNEVDLNDPLNWYIADSIDDYDVRIDPEMVDVINTLSAAQTKGALKSELKRYLSPALLLLD